MKLWEQYGFIALIYTNTNVLMAVPVLVEKQTKSVVTGGNSKYGLMLQVTEFCQQENSCFNKEVRR